MPQDADAALKKVRAAKPVAEKIFHDLIGEVAIGITRVEGVYGLKVNLAAHPAAEVRLPTTVDGVPVRVEVTGPVRKRPAKKT